MAERLNQTKSGETRERWARWADGVYRAPNGTWFFIHGGVLFLPTDRIHPVRLLTWPKPWQVVVMGDTTMIFLRAGDVIEEWPQLAERVKRIAANCGCSL